MSIDHVSIYQRGITKRALKLYIQAELDKGRARDWSRGEEDAALNYEQFSNHINEIFPNLVLGGDKCLQGVMRGYPQSWNGSIDLEQTERFFLGDYPIDNPGVMDKNAVDFTPLGTDGAMKFADVVVSANTREDRRTRLGDDGIGRHEAFLKDGGRHITANPQEETDDFVDRAIEVAQLIREGNLVYVHCNQGKDRSVMFAVLVTFALLEGEMPEKMVIEFMKFKRLFANDFSDPNCHLAGNFPNFIQEMKQKIQAREADELPRFVGPVPE